MNDRPLWAPSAARANASNLKRFMDFVAQRHGVNATDYDSLWAWSIAHVDQYWTAVWDFCGVKSESRGARALIDGLRA